MTLVVICLAILRCMHLSGTVVEIWPFEVLPRKLFQEWKSVVGRSVARQYYTDLI